MNNDSHSIDLNSLFVDIDAPEEADAFASRVMESTAQLRFQRNARRVALGILVALLLPPLQDFGLVVTQVMLVSVLPLDGGLLAELLAPINSVGAVLSAVLFSMRVFYKRLFGG